MLQKRNEANTFYKKVDSIFQSNKNYISIEVGESYKSLSNYYKEKKDIENQLLYVQRQSEFYGILKKNYGSLSKKISSEFDIPKLLKQERDLIEALKKTARKRIYIKLFLVIVVFIVISLLYYQYRKIKRYNNIIKNGAFRSSSTSKMKDLDHKTRESINVPDEIIERVLSRLEKLENNEEFLNPDIYVNDIAKQCGTNQRYISNVVNAYKKKNFSRYLNDLRIGYTIDKLQNNKKFILFSIDAIAEEVGFNNRGTFADAFKKSKGITPSFFIERLKKKLDFTKITIAKLQHCYNIRGGRPPQPLPDGMISHNNYTCDTALKSKNCADGGDGDNPA